MVNNTTTKIETGARDSLNECFIWRGNTFLHGFPYERRQLLHRVAYQWAYGPLAKRERVEHICGNRACVNPAHIRRIADIPAAECYAAALERFWSYVERGRDCWMWTGPRTQRGDYGQFSVAVAGKTRNIRAHRYIFEALNGFITDARVVMHSCDNGLCVNPAHLSLGTYRDNNDDMIAKRRHRNARKTHCKNGHELSGDNLRIKRGTNYRSCKACAEESAKRLAANPAGRRYWKYKLVPPLVARSFDTREEARQFLRDNSLVYRAKVVRDGFRDSPSSIPSPLEKQP